MKSEKEVRTMINKVFDYKEGLSWWEDGEETCCAIIDALLWVIGDKSGKSIDPEDWSDAE